MILPDTTDNRTATRPLATLLLFGVTLALACVVLGLNWRNSLLADGLLQTVGIVPAHLQPLTLLSYPLFHASAAHFLLNACYLWVFGTGVEAAVGGRRTLLLFFAGGIVGGLLQWVITVLLLPGDAQQPPIVGASAACAGLVGLYAVRYYRASLRLVGSVRVHVVPLVALFLVWEIGGGLVTLLQGDAPDGVAHWAHIGGFIFGLSCAWVLRLADAGERAYLQQDATQAMREGNTGMAITRWEQALARDPDNANARVELSRAWLLLGDREQAAHQTRLALAALLGQNRAGEAARLYTDAANARIAVRDLDSADWYRLGSALQEQGRHAQAADALHHAALYHADLPHSKPALLKLIGLHTHHLHHLQEARLLLRLFAQRFPDSMNDAQVQNFTRALDEQEQAQQQARWRKEGRGRGEENSPLQSVETKAEKTREAGSDAAVPSSPFPVPSPKE